MKKTPHEYAKALYQVTRGLSDGDREQVIKNFVVLLSRHGQLQRADQIIEAFERYAKRQEGVVEIAITAAHPLEGKTVREISGIFGKKVIATTKTDKTLLGGVVIRTIDKIFDGSLKTQLKKLAQSMV